MSEQKLGRYRLLSLLATGGMGEVFLARAPRARRPVVIERVLPAMASDGDVLRLGRRSFPIFPSVNV